MKSGKIGAIGIAVVMIIAGFICGICQVRVPAGYVAVQYNMRGGVQDDVLTQGWHLVSPTIKTTLYTVGIEQSYLTSGEDGDSKNNERFSASSSEGKAVDIDLTFTYQYQSENVVDVFKTFKGQSGKDVRDSFIKPNIVSWTKEVIARYPVADIIGAERSNINLALTEYLSEKFATYGITISNVSLINIEVDAATSDVINNKIAAQQNAETQAIENKTAIEKAEAEAQVVRTKAQAEADAELIQAQAQAEANKLLKASLSDEVLQEQWIEAWDGKLPTVSGSNSMMIGLPDTMIETE